MSDKLERLLKLSPHNRFLGIQFSSIDDGELTTKLEYRTDLAGDSDTGVLHGGVINALMDATCSGAVLVKLGALTRISTLELRVDTLKPSTKERPLYASCHCLKLTQPVAFVEGVAYHLNDEGERDIIAQASGTFMMMLPRPGAAL